MSYCMCFERWFWLILRSREQGINIKRAEQGLAEMLMLGGDT